MLIVYVRLYAISIFGAIDCFSAHVDRWYSKELQRPLLAVVFERDFGMLEI